MKNAGWAMKVISIVQYKSISLLAQRSWEKYEHKETFVNKPNPC